MRSSRLTRTAAVAGVAILTLAVTFAVPSPVAATASHVLIQGTGSTWAANAVNQWDADVTSSGLQVVFTGTGSAQGRKDFANFITDFGVTDIGFQGVDPGSTDLDSNCVNGKCRPYAYEPVVAGGTSFPYQIKVAGQLVRNLRLSGLTLAKIFTYQITNWDDPAVTADNNGRRLPSLPIIVVSHSEGSGSTAQFSTYLWKLFPTIWTPFNKGINNFTEYYPSPSGSQHGIQQNGSDGVMNFITSSAADGAIGYDEYSYALAKNYPVAKVLNTAGYYTLPSQFNVAVALQHAVINMDKSSPDLLQDLHNVYVAPETQVYPLSSYSYILVPTGTDAQDSRMTTAKRQTLADYLYYAVCQGQREIGAIGYSPLPINLVEASFAQTALLKAADPGVDLTSRDVSTCQNPTFVAGQPKVNHLAQIAPVPAACDRKGAGPMNNDGTCPGAGSGPGSGSGGGGTGTGGTGNGSSTGKNGSGGANAGTGGTGGTGGFGDTGNTGNYANAAQPQPADLASYRSRGLTGVLGPLAVVELIALLLVPPLIFIYASRRRRKTP